MQVTYLVNAGNKLVEMYEQRYDANPCICHELFTLFHPGYYLPQI